jgi:EmrB/QacA subfamily drug resistance transporter
MAGNQLSTPAPRQLWTLVLASLGLFICALDTLIVSTALPVLRVDLGASLEQLEWTVNTYNLAFACLLLTGAALGDRFGRRRMFSLGLLGFALSSALAAVSPDIEVLILARALQGAFAALVFPLSLTLISEAFPVEKRSTAIGIWGGIAGMAVAAGPVVGGAIIEGIDWHWIFWINVPIGLLLVPLCLKRLSESYGTRPQLDVLGVVLSAGGVLGITWALVRANIAGWGSPEVIGTLLAGLVVGALFFVWETRAKSPMLVLGLFRDRGFASANGVSFFMYAALFGSLFLISQFLQTALHFGPLAAGLRILPWTATPMVVAPIAGALAEKYGNRPFMTLGLTLQAIGLAGVALLASADVSYLELGIALIVAGVGISMCFPTVASAVVSSVPLSEAGVASGANSAMRELGGVFGVAVLAAVFANQGGYETPQAFIDGFVPGIWVGAGLSVIGVVAALFAPGRVAVSTREAALSAIPVPVAD